MHIVLASAIGAPMNPSKIANTFAGERQMIYSNKTISNHIDYLADAFLISKASRYDIKGRKKCSFEFQTAGVYSYYGKHCL